MSEINKLANFVVEKIDLDRWRRISPRSGELTKDRLIHLDAI